MYLQVFVVTNSSISLKLSFVDSLSPPPPIAQQNNNEN